MDYRYYRGEGIELPDWVVHRLYLLRYVGVFMIASPPVLAVLMIFGVIKLSLFWFFAGILMGTFGNVFFVIGMTYDTVFDRDSKIGVRKRFGLPEKKGQSKLTFAGRKLIYEPEDPLEEPD